MSKWDKKAKTYTRYSKDLDRFETKILNGLEEIDVKIKDKSIVDIGCGTGVYTLRIAQSAYRVDAIDSSSEMLEILKEDAKKLHVENISTFHQSWDSFMPPKKPYDIAISTMSPAISSDESFMKMTKCADVKVFLGWAGFRTAVILDALFKAHNAVYTQPNGAKKLTSWLEQQNIPCQVLPFDEKRETRKDYEASVESFIWHLEIRGISPDKDKVRNILKEFCNDSGVVVEKIHSKMELVIW